MAVALQNGMEFRPIRSPSAYTYGGIRPVYWDTVFKEIPTCSASTLLSAVSWKEPSFRYQPVPRFTATTRLVGYFQSYRYFEAVQNRILAKFAFPKASELRHFLQQVRGSYQQTTTTKATTISNGDSSGSSSGSASPVSVVSLHIRSYVEPDGSQAPAAIHCRLDEDYYRQAISLCGERVVFLVFADDVNYARQLLSPLTSPALVFLQDLDDWKTLGDVGELQLMSLCDGQILANSTFSWWAAFLATARRAARARTQALGSGQTQSGTDVATASAGLATTKLDTKDATLQGATENTPPLGIVVAPRRWFGPNGPGAEDLIPPSWTLL